MRLCLGGCGRWAERSRCARCEQEYKAARNAKRNATSPYHSTAWRQASCAARRRDGRCLICGADPTRDRRVRLHGHHIVRREDGGPDHESNVMTVCAACHPAVEVATKRRDPTDALYARLQQIGAAIRGRYSIRRP